MHQSITTSREIETTVMVIDDAPAIRDLLTVSFGLYSFHYHAPLSFSRRQAYGRILDMDSPGISDFVLLDFSIPDSLLLSLLKALQGKRTWSGSMPFIIGMTTWDNLAWRHSNAFHHIVYKPFDFSHLFLTCEQVRVTCARKKKEGNRCEDSVARSHQSNVGVDA